MLLYKNNYELSLKLTLPNPYTKQVLYKGFVFSLFRSHMVRFGSYRVNFVSQNIDFLRLYIGTKFSAGMCIIVHTYQLLVNCIIYQEVKA